MIKHKMQAALTKNDESEVEAYTTADPAY